MTSESQGPELLQTLMADATVYCNASMRFHGNLVPSVIFHAAQGVGIFTARNLYGDIKNEDFAQLARLMCTVHAADAAVLAFEVWCGVPKARETLDVSMPPLQGKDRQEAVVMEGDSRGNATCKLMPIARYRDGRFAGFDKQSTVQSEGVQGRFSNLLVEPFPNERAQKKARRDLQMKGIWPDNGAMRIPKGMDDTPHHIISPDGLPLTPEPFGSKQLAEEFVPKYCVRMRGQGYYAAVGERILLDDLPGRLVIVPAADMFEGVSKVMRQNQDREKCRGRQRGVQRGM